MQHTTANILKRQLCYPMKEHPQILAYVIPKKTVLEEMAGPKKEHPQQLIANAVYNRGNGVLYS